jgi:hypothetical protein
MGHHPAQRRQRSLVPPTDLRQLCECRPKPHAAPRTSRLVRCAGDDPVPQVDGTPALMPRIEDARLTCDGTGYQCPFPSKVSSCVVADLRVVQVQWDFRASLVPLQLRSFPGGCEQRRRSRRRRPACGRCAAQVERDCADRCSLPVGLAHPQWERTTSG